MNIKEIMAVTGLPGLFEMVSNRANGLMIKNLETGKVKFASTRKYQFSPLESISVYTKDDALALSEVFTKMMASPPPAELGGSKASKNDLETYFISAVPDYDDERVHQKDIKKIIKWYHQLDKHGLLTASGDEEE